MSNRNRTRHDDKDKMFQVKGKTTRKILDAQAKGDVNIFQGLDRDKGATRTNRDGK